MSKSTATGASKRAQAHQDDVQYFDNVLRKARDIRQMVMPEYFSMPSWWVATVKMKGGESAAERQVRDWTTWRKQYARTFRDKGLQKIDGILFYAAKITPGVYLALIRAGKRAYCLEYSRQFGTDDTSFKGLIALDSFYPLAMATIRAANEYHRLKRSDKASMADVDTARDAYNLAFDAACEVLRAIDTAPTAGQNAADVAPTAPTALIDAAEAAEAAHETAGQTA
jgi:hypothetical protein